MQALKLCALGTALLASSTAHAADCRQIDATVTGGQWSAQSESAFRAELRVEIERAGLCLVAVSSGEAVGHVRAEWEAQLPISLSVSFLQGSTERTLRRQFAATQLPSDGLMLALAAVVGELLHEARLVPERPQAPTVSGVPARSLSLRVAAEFYSAGQTQAGGEVALRVGLARWLDAELFIGARAALPRASTDGEVSAMAATAGLSAIIPIIRGEQLTFGGLAGIGFGWLWFNAVAKEGAMAKAAQGWTAFLRGGLELAFRPGATVWSVSAGAGAPLRGFVARDSNSTISGAAGVEGYVSVAGGWCF